MILTAIFLDTTLQPDVRMQRFLEVFGNSLLRQDTFEYLAEKCRQLEALVQLKMGGDKGTGLLAELFNIDLLSYQSRDELLGALVAARADEQFDMAKAWDGRCRLWYSDRYDFRRNMVRVFQLRADGTQLAQLQEQARPGHGLSSQRRACEVPACRWTGTITWGCHRQACQEPVSLAASSTFTTFATGDKLEWRSRFATARTTLPTGRCSALQQAAQRSSKTGGATVSMSPSISVRAEYTFCLA